MKKESPLSVRLTSKQRDRLERKRNLDNRQEESLSAYVRSILVDYCDDLFIRVTMEEKTLIDKVKDAIADPLFREFWKGVMDYGKHK